MMPPPGCKLGDTSPSPSRPGRKSTRELTRSPDPEHSFSDFTKLPAEIQQMIWAEHIKCLSCHHFKLARLDFSGTMPTRRQWMVELSESLRHKDPSAYCQWKAFLEVGDYGLIETYRRMTTHMQIQSITLQRGGQVLTHNPKARIDAPNDLVVLDFQRGLDIYDFTWFEHSMPSWMSTMNVQGIQRRLQHFRKVAINYKARHIKSTQGGPFLCFCSAPGMQCYKFKACPLELACFLDCFQNLEEFYFIVENPKKIQDTGFTVQYKEKVGQQNYQVVREILYHNSERATEMVDLKRFFDGKTEFLQQASPSVLEKLGLDKRSPYNTPRDCLITTMKVFKSKMGYEPFIQPLESRTQVKFGLLIPYERSPTVVRSQNGEAQN